MDLNITAKEVNGMENESEGSPEPIPEEQMVAEASALIYASIETEDCEFLDSDEEEEEKEEELKYSKKCATPTIQKQMDVDRTTNKMEALSMNRISERVRHEDSGRMSARKMISQMNVPVMTV
mmetsp:Transcript_16715/g.25770  ORF Transcript_16715/g.25770 Transcript_16715/m.25770 type:complete len:123 (+) Transcript_16715:1040-1408(+)|eukprot:CAMPEP_0170507662 /NCGR_PEP_ID=MMETSP0208-20121228/59626_1 /TAXON_ID=197538 /ORGANISM="Strombidium inclinatum, Strain S3" /LENGTH=122 /DNA_ID=CAMNT_0010790011 /DNA_START=1004 /DNA_END=1372 /DNA_ORIENTATION=+